MNENQANQPVPSPEETTPCPPCGPGKDFRTTIGGQALLEGILMRGPKRQAIVVRKPDGALEIRNEELKLIKDRYPILGVPFIRGVVNFLDSMVKGIQALMWSAEFYPEDGEPEEPSRLEKWIEKRFGSEALFKWIIAIAMLAGLGFAIALFVILPPWSHRAFYTLSPTRPCGCATCWRASSN